MGLSSQEYWGFSPPETGGGCSFFGRGKAAPGKHAPHTRYLKDFGEGMYHKKLANPLYEPLSA